MFAHGPITHYTCLPFSSPNLKKWRRALRLLHSTEHVACRRLVVLTCVFSGHLLFPAGLQLKINTALFPALFHPVARLVLLYFGRNRLATVGCNRNITRTTKADGKSPSKCQLKKRKQEKNLEDDKRFFKAMNCFNIQEDIVKTCI